MSSKNRQKLHTMDKSSNTERVAQRPDPSDLQAYLPWACTQLQLPKDLVIVRNFQNEYVSAGTTDRGKAKPGKSRPRIPSVMDDQEKESVSVSQEETDVIRINAVYDYADNLVALRFDKNSSLPRMIMQVLGLIIKFQVYLQSITVNRGLNKYFLYELVRLLPNSKITDICLDNCFLSEGTYYTLLEHASNLKNLSLSRCRINDEVVALIVAQLCYPQPGSTTLVILNLSSNRITDIGAQSISEALKVNFKLAYLNLADNMITDEGAASIFNVLLEFPLKNEEVIDMRRRHINYLRSRRAAVLLMAKDLRVAEQAKIKKITPRPKTKGKEDIYIASDKSVCLLNDAYFLEKAEAMANELSPFKDPYSSENVTSRDGKVYCLGNSYLSMLNLSYNSLSYLSLVKLVEVLTYQRQADRKPKGLLGVRVEGNALPVGCWELALIEEMLDYALSGRGKRATLPVKKKGK